MDDPISASSHLAGGRHLRASRVEDAEALTALSNLPGYRYGTMRLPFQTVADTRRFLESRSENDVHLVVIENDQLVASGSLKLFSGRRRHAAVLGMGVHDDHVGRGIGSTLLSAILDVADNWLDLKRVELTVFADNARAIALYEKHGFISEGLLTSYAYRDGSYADVRAMARLR